MIKYVSGTILACLISLFCAKAQQNTYSPNSSFGLGEIVSSEYSRTAGMAGVGIGVRNGSFLNTSNPAAVSALDSMSGVFDVGVYGKASNYKSNSYNDNAFTGNLRKIAFGFRANKVWSISIGIRPFSNVGYRIASDVAVEGSNSTKTIYFEGEGGLYSLYAINAVKLGDKLSVGVITSMIAGTFTNIEDQVSYSYKTTSRLTQIYNKLGAQYQLTNGSGDWVVGATYGYKQNIGVKRRFSIYSGTTEESSEELKTINQFLPENIGAGISWKKEKFLFAADYEWEGWSGLSSNVDNVKIGDSHKIKAGVGYTPYRDLYTAHSAKQYQFGVALNKSYIEMKNKAAWNYALTTGILFPLRAGQTQKGILGIGLEYGSNLTAPSGFVKENYLMLNVNFSFIETMFMRSKIF
ncbi:MAG: hypothetical protein H6Q14_2096 [Bacteroidetes bacterium]|nr:hypothetical protein [Bacteroidota bacterium]